MTKKKRRQMTFTLTLSVMIAAVPLSLAFLCEAGNDLPGSISYFEKAQPQQESNTGKILPILANN